MSQLVLFYAGFALLLVGGLSLIYPLRSMPGMTSSGECGGALKQRAEKQNLPG